MTADELDREYARQLTAMAAARIEHENPRHLRLLARETRRRRGAEMPAPRPGAELRIWADLHFDDERIRRAAERPWPGIEPMNAALRRAWRESAAPGATMVCAGDMGGRRTILGRRHPPCEGLPGPWHTVLGNHDFTRILGRRKPMGGGTESMTLVIRSDPPLVVTHVPLTDVPDGCVNVHGHEHAFKPLRQGPWINVSVEQTLYRPLDVRTQIIPLARALAARWIPPGLTTAERVRHAPLAGL